MVTKCIIDEIPTEIYDFLDRIGVPSHIQGYDYSAYAVTLLLENPEMLHHTTKELYPSVAKAFNSTSSRVERSIRHALEVLFLNGDYEEITKVFGYSVSPNTGRPVVSQFLSTIMRKVRREILSIQESCDKCESDC